MVELSHKRLAEHFTKIESLCYDGWRICRESPEAAERWAEQHSYIAQPLDDGTTLPGILEAAICCCRLNKLDGIAAELNKLRWRASVVDTRPVKSLALSDALFALRDFAKGYFEEIDWETPDESHESLQAATQSNGQSTSDSEQTPQVAPQWDEETDARNKWLYVQCCAGTAYKRIINELKSQPGTNISSISGVKRAANEYAKRNNLPPIPKRRNGRPRTK